MFSHLVAQLRSDVETVEKVLLISDALRNLLIAQQTVLAALPADPAAGAEATTIVAHDVRHLLDNMADKLDWQIYDHCAALTRLYAVYERFVGDLVGEFVLVLPDLYAKYSDLPIPITTQHRVGIGNILLKIGEKGRFRNLEEQVVVRELATGLSGASGYTLLADAFFIDRQNLRFETLCRLFSSLGFKQCGRYINRHDRIVAFLKDERADASSAQKELGDFIDYRNEAAHKKVDNVLAVEAIATFGRFLTALARALADMVEEMVLRRRIDLNQCSPVLNVTEVHYDGFVVIGVAVAGTKISIGSEVVVVTKTACRRAKIESLQINGANVEEITGDGTTEVGLRLSKRGAPGADLCRIEIPTKAPKEIQLNLEEALVPIADRADTDIDTATEIPESSDATEQVGTNETQEPLANE